MWNINVTIIMLIVYHYYNNTYNGIYSYLLLTVHFITTFTIGVNKFEQI